jgi:peroxiredoxin (alkyl hydroperoxide reductase subunit C)
MPLTTGSPAPAFTLRDQDRQEVTLDDLKGRRSLVVFIPFPFTGMCRDELCSIRDHRAALDDLDANVVAITCDTLFANKRWSEDQNFGFRILSDFWPHGAVAQAYDVFNEKTGSVNRVTYVLDADGVIRDVIDSGSLAVAREVDAYTEALARI